MLHLWHYRGRKWKLSETVEAEAREEAIPFRQTGTSRERLHLSWGCNENQGLGMFELEKERMASCRRENRRLNVHGGKKREAWSRDVESSGLATSYEFSGWEWNLDTSVWIRHSRTLNTSLRNFFIKQWGFFGYLWTKNKKEAAHQSTIFLPLSLTQCHTLSFVPEEGGPSCV